jgi:hypothetical protein
LVDWTAVEREADGEGGDGLGAEKEDAGEDHDRETIEEPRK